jgi:hypothetical protein
MQIATRFCAAFAFLGSVLPLGGCRNDEVVALPWADAKVESLATLDNPWAMAFLPDGQLLITEKPGKLRIYVDGKLSGAIGGVPKVEYHEQGGLLDVAVDPDFANNQLIDLSYAESAPEQPADAKDEGDPRLGPSLESTYSNPSAYRGVECVFVSFELNYACLGFEGGKADATPEISLSSKATFVRKSDGSLS